MASLRSRGFRTLCLLRADNIKQQSLMMKQHLLLFFSPWSTGCFKQSLKTGCEGARILLPIKLSLTRCRDAQEQHSSWIPRDFPQREQRARTCERMLVHCCSSDTGGLPMLVASCTRRSCSFRVAFSCKAWARATAAHQLERESVEKRPPQSSWPAETELPVATRTAERYKTN